MSEMTVKRSCFKDDTGESLCWGGPFKDTMLARGYTKEDTYDTCVELMRMFIEAGHLGGYEADFSDYEAEGLSEYETLNFAADCYVFGINPSEHSLAISNLDGVPKTIIDGRVELSDFVEACVTGGVIEMLDAWLAGVPLTHIAPEYMEKLY